MWKIHSGLNDMALMLSLRQQSSFGVVVRRSPRMREVPCSNLGRCSYFLAASNGFASPAYLNDGKKLLLFVNFEGEKDHIVVKLFGYL